MPAAIGVAVDQLFGFIGLLIAVPIITTATVLIDELWIRRSSAEPSSPRSSRSGARWPTG